MPAGDVGRMVVESTTFLTYGYWGQPDKTAATFLPSVNNLGGRAYHIGDLGQRSSEGLFEHRGRQDFQAKIRGQRVELAGIEAVLLQQEGVKDAVVVAQQSPDGDSLLVAYVVAEQQARDVSALRAALAASLPQYMVPQVVMWLDSLPQTASGKTDRRALPDPHAARLELQRANYMAPRTPLEEELAAIWQTVCGVDRVGIKDNFLDLGGHSLLATRIMSRVAAVWGVSLPVHALFEEPTVEGLARQIASAGAPEAGTRAEPLKPIPRDRELPLSFSQERQWLLDRLETEAAAYNVGQTFRVVGRLNLAALTASVARVIERHESLRTAFRSGRTGPVQVILPAPVQVVQLVDFSSIPQSLHETETRRLVREHTARPFALEQGHLFRSLLIEESKEHWLLRLTMHHIVSDRWSMRNLLHELWRLYEACVWNEPCRLPNLALQYADFAQWQRDSLRGPALERLVSYWRNHLRDAPPLLKLPTDLPRPQVQTFHGAAIPFDLTGPVAEQIKRVARNELATPFMTMLCGFKALLYAYSGQQRINVGTFISNRSRAELEPLIGFFINNLVISTNLAGEPTFRELLARVRTVTLDAYAHQDLPFEKLLEELKPVRNSSYPPLFQVMFVMQNAPRETRVPEGLTVTQLDSLHDRSNFDLTVWMWETEGGFQGSWEFNTYLFEETTVNELMDQYHAAMAQFMEHPDRAISDTPVIASILSLHAQTFFL